jgi:hypothetical protein
MLNGKILEGVAATAEYFQIIEELERGELVSVERLIFALQYAAHRLEVAADLVESRKYGTAFVVAKSVLHYLPIVTAVFAGDDPSKVKE